MTQLAYEDLSIWFRPQPERGGYWVELRSSAGEGSAFFKLPAELTTLGRRPRDLPVISAGEAHRGLETLASTRQPPPLRPREIGDLLFQALFSGPVRQLYDRVRGACASPGRGVRIKLHFDHDGVPELCQLPWEMLYAEETKDYLGLDRTTPLVRYLDLPRPTTLPPFTPPLRVLLARANPASTDTLGLAEESDQIERLLAGTADVEVLEHTHLDSLREYLLRQPCHILHFMGHGIFDERTGNGSLLLEAPGGGQEIVSGEVLANHLKGCLPQLVVVNACESGRAVSATGQDFYRGIATSLVMAGVPAVVAMRTPITDHAATAFSVALYRDLAAGAPVDAAVTEGRMAIYRGDVVSPEWTVPALFMRVPDGQLFTAATPAADAARQPAPGEALPVLRDEIHVTGNVRASDVCAQQGGSQPTFAASSVIKIDGSVEGATIVSRRYTN